MPSLMAEAQERTSSRYEMTSLDQVIAAVPIGESNATTQRQIALSYGIGAPSTWGAKLRQAVGDGSIKRRKEMRPSGFAWVYWRKGL